MTRVRSRGSSETKPRVVLGSAVGYVSAILKRGRGMKRPQDCENMAEIRVEIDRLDCELVALFAQRTAYVDRAAEIKETARLPARITPRVEEVVANVRTHAEAHGLPPDTLEKLWRRLIEWSIAREETRLGKDHGDDGTDH